MRANYWTQFGAMALPLGVSLIALAIVFSDWKDILIKAGLVSIAIGVFSFVTGWAYTIRDERQNQEDRKQEQKRRKEQEKKREKSHFLDRLIQEEILRKLGIPPRRVIRKYRDWLSEQNKDWRADDEL